MKTQPLMIGRKMNYSWLLDYAVRKNDQELFDKLLEAVAVEVELHLWGGHWKQARKKARILLQRLPDKNHILAGRAHRVLGFVDFQNRKPERGLHHFERALAIFDQHDLYDLYRDVTLHLSHHLAEKGQYEEAFNRLIDLDDKLIKCLINRGIVLFSKKVISG